SPLFEVVQSHLLEFLDATRRRADGAGVPAFVERELRDFLAIGPLWRLLPGQTMSDRQMHRSTAQSIGVGGAAACPPGTQYAQRLISQRRDRGEAYDI
ncbi:MAG: hypothetical protein RL698_2192, partial [Pseudomonadota bacterium]